MDAMITTGAIFNPTIKNEIFKNICAVFGCSENQIEDLSPLEKGMTNIVLSFKLNGGKYVYRHPGVGSDTLVERGRETIMQKVVEDIGIDTTLIAMDVDSGWRISHYIEHRQFDYHNMNDMVRAVMLLKKLHEAPCRVRWNFDVMEKAEKIKTVIPQEKYGNFPEFEQIRKRCYELYALTKRDGIKHCNIHGDARDVNFLINQEEIYLIDWEYGGYGDPGFDIGSYICGGEHTREDIDRILFTYYKKPPTQVQKNHFYGYIALTGWFYLHWTMLKEAKGQKIGVNKNLWYSYTRDYSSLALKMYSESVD